MNRADKYPDTSTFHFHNANPKNKLTGDCVIRAISTATNVSWEMTFDNLYFLARSNKLMPNDKKCYEKYLKSLGWVKHSQPHKEDGTKYRGFEFCELLQDDCYLLTGRDNPSQVPIIAHIGSHHIVCIKDGKIWDVWDSSNGCIGNYWTKGY